MLKKTVLTFAFLTILTTFYGFNAHFSTPVMDDVLNETAETDYAPHVEESRNVISAYDNLIRRISEQEGHDWRLMSAIAYHESRFTPDITSRSGARGLMQMTEDAFGGAPLRGPARPHLGPRDERLAGQQADDGDSVDAAASGEYAREGPHEHCAGVVQQRNRPCE